MSTLTVWKDEKINKLRKDMDRLFDRCWSDFGVGLFVEEVSSALSIKMTETKDSLVVKVTLKGINPENLDISMTDDTLTIHGEKREETTGGTGYYSRVERRFSSFSRTLRLPCRVKTDSVEATYKEGKLTILMPKWNPKKIHTVKIEVK